MKPLAKTLGRPVPDSAGQPQMVPDVPAVPGLGDRVHQLAGPIGRAIHWPCLKGDGSTDLIPGSPCDKLKRMLNAKF